MDWPFSDPENVATITLRRILNGESDILYVSHDEEDGTWQFLDGNPCSTAEAMLVALREIYKHDPSIAEVATLELGFVATRTVVGAPWKIQKESKTV